MGGRQWEGDGGRVRDSHLVLMDVDMLALNLKGLPEALRREVLQPALHEVSKDYLDLTKDPEETGDVEHIQASYLNEECY